MKPTDLPKLGKELLAKHKGNIKEALREGEEMFDDDFEAKYNKPFIEMVKRIPMPKKD